MAFPCSWKTTHTGKITRNLDEWLTEHKRATRNSDFNNGIAERHLKAKRAVDRDSATCLPTSRTATNHLSSKAGLPPPSKVHSDVANHYLHLVNDSLKETVWFYHVTFTIVACFIFTYFPTELTFDKLQLQTDQSEP